MGRYLDIAKKVEAQKGGNQSPPTCDPILTPELAVSGMVAMPEEEPSHWSRLADSGLHHNDVSNHAEVIFLFALELITDPSKAREDCQTLPAMWAYYAPFWRERLPGEAFTELERRYRRRLADLGLPDDPQPPQDPKSLRPLELNAEGTGCAECGSQEYWVSIKGARYCLACHPAPIREMITIGTIRPAKEAVSRRSTRRRRRA